jgi:hypothetical protein
MSAHVSAAHAARMYGRSEKTVRRWIASGKLPAEKIDGAYLVDLADVAQLIGDVSAQMSAPTSAPGADGVSTQSTDTDVRPDEEDVRPSALVQAEALTSLIQTTIAAVLGPLVGQLDAQRQTIERQAEQLVSQAETIGRQSAELERAAAAVVALGEENEALRASHAKQDANPGPVATDATTDAPVPLPARLRALAPWLLAVLAVAALAVLLMAGIPLTMPR